MHNRTRADHQRSRSGIDSVMSSTKEMKAYQAAYRAAHREERKAYAAAYYEAHREEHNAKGRMRAKAYYAAHREECNAKSRAYYAAHREKVKAHNAAYRAKMAVKNAAIRLRSVNETKAHIVAVFTELVEEAFEARIKERTRSKALKSR